MRVVTDQKEVEKVFNRDSEQPIVPVDKTFNVH